MSSLNIECYAISKYIVVKIEELNSEPIILGGLIFSPPINWVIVIVIIKCSDSVIGNIQVWRHHFKRHFPPPTPPFLLCHHSAY